MAICGRKPGLAPDSGVASGKEMEDTVDVGGVADVSEFHVEIDKTVKIVHLDGKNRAIRQVVDQGVDLAEVDLIGKNFFHVRLLATNKIIIFYLAGLGGKRHKINISGVHFLKYRGNSLRDGVCRQPGFRMPPGRKEGEIPIRFDTGRGHGRITGLISGPSWPQNPILPAQQEVPHGN